MTDQPKLSARERIQREACELCARGVPMPCVGPRVHRVEWDEAILGWREVPCTAPTPDAIIERLDAELSTQRALTSQHREMAGERLAQVKRLESEFDKLKNEWTARALECNSLREVVGKVREVLTAMRAKADELHNLYKQGNGVERANAYHEGKSDAMDEAAELLNTALSLLEAGKPEAPNQTLITRLLVPPAPVSYRVTDCGRVEVDTNPLALAYASTPETPKCGTCGGTGTYTTWTSNFENPVISRTCFRCHGTGSATGDKEAGK